MEMFEYEVCNIADNEIFEKQCKALENSISNLIKSELLTDVDGSMVRKYILLGNEVNVYNDFYKGGVYVKSEIDLMPYFNKN